MIAYTYRVEHVDAPLLARRFDSIEHDIIVLDNQRPCIAVSSLFSMDEVRKKDDIVRAVLNVLPVDARRTLAIFFYTSEDGPTARVALDRILLSKGDYGAGDAACGD